MFKTKRQNLITWKRIDRLEYITVYKHLIINIERRKYVSDELKDVFNST
jgi:hypothetical protein